MVALLPKPLSSYSSLAWARDESVCDRDEPSHQHLLGTRQLMVSVPPTSMPVLPFCSPLGPGPCCLIHQQQSQSSLLTSALITSHPTVSPALAIKTHTTDPLLQLTTQKSVALAARLPVSYRNAYSTHFLFPSVIRACFCHEGQRRE